MARHYHHYSELPDPRSGLLLWSVKSHELFPNAVYDGSDEVAAIQPVYVIPHKAVSKLSQWSRLKNVDFGSQ